MYEVVEVADQITKRIALLEKGRSELERTARAKAETAAEYAKVLAVAILRIKNNKPCELEGETTEKVPASVMSHVAKGLCWKEQMAADLAEAQYKLTVEKMDSIRAELNGFQSIFRHLETHTEGFNERMR
jgi:hypothetical protein